MIRIRMNAKMATLWGPLQQQAAQTGLRPSLIRLAQSPLILVPINPNQGSNEAGALVFESQLGRDWQIPPDFDEPRFEAWVNKIHIGDHLTPSEEGDSLVQAVLYAQALSASLERAILPTRIVLSRDPEMDEVTVRFLVRRPNSSWEAEDPNAYLDEEVSYWDIDPVNGNLLLVRPPH